MGIVRRRGSARRREAEHYPPPSHDGCAWLIRLPRPRSLGAGRDCGWLANAGTTTRLPKPDECDHPHPPNMLCKPIGDWIGARVAVGVSVRATSR